MKQSTQSSDIAKLQTVTSAVLAQTLLVTAAPMIWWWQLLVFGPQFLPGHAKKS